jgi:hypothetical protein
VTAAVVIGDVALIADALAQMSVAAGEMRGECTGALSAEQVARLSRAHGVAS